MLLAATGERSRAVTTLVEAADAMEVPLYQVPLLHEAFRAGAPPERIAPAFARVASNSDAPLFSALARLVTSAAARDGAALADVARALGAIGASLWAAEAAALAAEAYERAGRDDSARTNRALSWRLLESCENAWSPVLADLAPARDELTQREREIVSLAANGESNAEIAERLVLSVRTVESHLYRAMRKLGVSTRQELSAD